MQCPCDVVFIRITFDQSNPEYGRRLRGGTARSTFGKSVPSDAKAPFAPANAAPAAPKVRKELHIVLNDKPMTLLEKENGLPYYLMDLLQYSGLDFDRLDRPVRLEVNGQESGFRYELKERDYVTIFCV